MLALSAAFGIYVSKARLFGSWVDQATPKAAAARSRSASERVRWSKEVDNSVTGIQQFLDTLPPDVPWVLEPTGRYSILVAATARAAGREVLMAEPKRAQHFLQSLHGSLKTDPLDSKGLATYALHRPLPPYPLKSETVERLDQLRSARKGLSLSISRLHQQAQALPYAAAGLQVAIDQLEVQRREFDRQIAAILADREQFPMAEKFLAVQGVGPVTATAVLSCLSARQFQHPDQFVAYAGLAVTRKQSGAREGVARLSKHGDGELRRLLFLAAKSNLVCKQSPFKEQYQREKAKGLASTAALCAVARKLARVLWSM
jgi:transposase